MKAEISKFLDELRKDVKESQKITSRLSNQAWYEDDYRTQRN